MIEQKFFKIGLRARKKGLINIFQDEEYNKEIKFLPDKKVLKAFKSWNEGFNKK